MNAIRTISSALLLSALTLPLSAQASTMMKDPNQTGTSPTDPGDIQPPYNMRQREDDQRGPLELSIAGHHWHVTGGRQGARVAILLGLDTQALTLPGGAHLMLRPLAIFASGAFDENGDFDVYFGYDAKMLDPIEYHFQAISTDESGTLRTSGMRTLDFRFLGGAQQRTGSVGTNAVDPTHGDIGIEVVENAEDPVEQSTAPVATSKDNSGEGDEPVMPVYEGDEPVMPVYEGETPITEGEMPVREGESVMPVHEAEGDVSNL